MIRLIPKLVQLNACEESLMYLQSRRHPTFAEAHADVLATHPDWHRWLCEALSVPEHTKAADLEKALVSASPIEIPQDTWFYVGMDVGELVRGRSFFLHPYNLPDLITGRSSAARWGDFLHALDIDDLKGKSKIRAACHTYADQPRVESAYYSGLTARKLYTFLEKDDPTLAQEMQDLILELHAHLSPLELYPLRGKECTPECFDAALSWVWDICYVLELKDACYHDHEIEGALNDHQK